MEFLINIVANLISNIIWVFIGIFGAFLVWKFAWIKPLLDKLHLRKNKDVPQIDFEQILSSRAGKDQIAIKNAGNASAFNVYVFLVEVFNATPDKEFTTKSLGDQNVRIGVLAPQQKVTFTDKKITFEGCDVTTTQEIWIEYSDEENVHYRTRVKLPNPRGEDVEIIPSKIIKKRLSMIPGVVFHGTGGIDKIL